MQRHHQAGVASTRPRQHRAGQGIATTNQTPRAKKYMVHAKLLCPHLPNDLRAILGKSLHTEIGLVASSIVCKRRQHSCNDPKGSEYESLAVAMCSRGYRKALAPISNHLPNMPTSSRTWPAANVLRNATPLARLQTIFAVSSFELLARHAVDRSGHPLLLRHWYWHWP